MLLIVGLFVFNLFYVNSKLLDIVIRVAGARASTRNLDVENISALFSVFGNFDENGLSMVLVFFNSKAALVVAEPRGDIW